MTELMDDEAYVRQRWEENFLRQKWIQPYMPSNGCVDGWKKLKSFTENREGKIAEIEEEIQVIEQVLESILTRLQAALCELQRGMKGSQ